MTHNTFEYRETHARKKYPHTSCNDIIQAAHACDRGSIPHVCTCFTKYTARRTFCLCDTHGYVFLAANAICTKLIAYQSEQQWAPACDCEADISSQCYRLPWRLARRWTNDPGRTRTCNLWFRRPTPYPLGHRALDRFTHRR